MIACRHIQSRLVCKRIGAAQQARFSGTPSVAPPPVLTRDYIRDALYGDAGYFRQPSVILEAPMFDFTSMLGRSEYQWKLRAAYDASPTGWLTPVQIFAPIYSYAMANYVLQEAMRSQCMSPLVIYEVGGGLGSNARAVCDFLAARAPAAYKQLEYRILEISPQLCDAQRAKLGPHRSKLNKSGRPIADSIVADGTALAAAGVRDDRRCFVLAFEVLDNLPHDKVVILQQQQQQQQQGQEQMVCQTVVQAHADGGVGEAYVPLSDPLIADTWRALTAYRQAQHGQHAQHSQQTSQGAGKALSSLLGGLATRLSGSERWRALLPPAPPGLLEAHYVPTGCMAFLRSLHTAFPRCKLLLADFDALPPPKLSRATVAADVRVTQYAAPAATAGAAAGATAAAGGVGAVLPLVASKDRDSHQMVDHATYMSAAKGTADIFFPTDFGFLQHMVREVRAQQAVAVAAAPAGKAGAGAAPVVTAEQSGRFLARYADVSRTRTMSGYNPLLEDFVNTQILTAV